MVWDGGEGQVRIFQPNRNSCLWILEIKKENKKRAVDDRLRIKWGSLTMASALETMEKLMSMRLGGVAGM